MKFDAIAARPAVSDSPQISLSNAPPPVAGLPRAAWIGLPLALAALVAVLQQVAPDWSRHRLFAEGWGPVELAHFVIPLVAAVVAAVAWRRLPAGSDRGLSALLIALALGCFYIAGEEHSWGQHFFGWSTPEEWAALNRQDETNLHNTSSWLNHKPRVALNVLVALATIVVPAMRVAGRGGRLLDRVRFVLPGRETRVLGLLVVLYMTWDSLAKEGLVFRLAPREAEMHELFLYGFLLVYALELLRRVTAAQQSRRGG